MLLQTTTIELRNWWEDTVFKKFHGAVEAPGQSLHGTILRLPMREVMATLETITVWHDGVKYELHEKYRRVLPKDMPK